ncbi:MAG TPA: LacI family transcriptional regulator [Cytophagales bacterium]|jgi:DNA-binding LacI/PurR family transcriptional regulator|nr:LacI family transcriptional regulator [Cytophagales bacterium]
MSIEQVTIKDIARKLNIAPSTVSRALKDHPDISDATKKAVMEVAKEMDYQPNTVALSLRKSKTFTLGVIVPEIVHFFFSSIISGIEDVAYAEGYHVMICQSNEDFDREVSSTNALLMSRVDGMLISMSKHTEDYDHFRTIQKRGIPIVFFDRVCKELDTSTVVAEDHHGAYEATEHLIKAGCRKIMHLEGPTGLLISKNRKQGFLDAMKDYDLSVKDEWISKADNFEEGYKTLKEVLIKGDKPDAVFTINDKTALGAMKAIKEHGLRIPTEIAIVGFSDDPNINVLIDPPLTSVAQPGYDMGTTAARLFFDHLSNKESLEITHEVLKTQLVIRESSLFGKEL